MQEPQPFPPLSRPPASPPTPSAWQVVVSKKKMREVREGREDKEEKEAQREALPLPLPSKKKKRGQRSTAAPLQLFDLIDAQLKAITAPPTPPPPPLPPPSLLSPPTLPPSSPQPSLESTLTPPLPQKRAKMTKAKRQILHEKITRYVRTHIVLPLIHRVTGMEDPPPLPSDEAARVERAERRKALRVAKKKQRRLASETSTSSLTSALTDGEGEDGEGLAKGVGAAVGEGGEEDEAALDAAVYRLTDEERALLFQHVVVDGYHTQPPLSPLSTLLCCQLLTSSIDASLTQLLLLLSHFQRRLHTLNPIKSRLRGKRIACGMREVTRKVRQGKAVMVVVAWNNEEEVGGGVDGVVREAEKRGVEVVWGLSRRRLGTACGMKGKVGVMAVLNADGCWDGMKELKGKVKEARERWEMRGWDERVEPGVIQRREEQRLQRSTRLQEWEGKEAEERKEAERLERIHLAKVREEERKREEVRREKEKERREEQIRNNALRKEEQERKEQERLEAEREKEKKKLRDAHKKKEEAGGRAQGGESKEGGEKGRKGTWLEEAVDTSLNEGLKGGKKSRRR